jgi:hypothetical protein
LAPYIHTRLAPVDAAIRLDSLTGSLAAQVKTVLAALANGKVTPGQASTLMQIIANQSKITKSRTGETLGGIGARSEKLPTEIGETNRWQSTQEN